MDWKDLKPATLKTVVMSNPYQTVGADDFVHPSVMFSAEGWQGWHYWMAITPYNTADNHFENPCILVSQSPAGPWSVPEGGMNPIFAAGSQGYYSDPHLFLDPATQHLVLTWRGSYMPDRKNGADTFYYSTSSDGVHWSEKTLWASPVTRAVSHSVVYADGRWLMFITELNPAGNITQVARAARWQDLFTVDRQAIEPQLTPDGGRLWHTNAAVVGGQVLLIGSTNGSAGGPVWLASSRDSDGRTWTWGTTPVLAQGGYRSQVLPVRELDGVHLDFWLGSAGRDWRISYGRSKEVGQ